MPTHRQADGAIVIEDCPECGWQYPAGPPAVARGLAYILEQDGTVAAQLHVVRGEP